MDSRKRVGCLGVPVDRNLQDFISELQEICMENGVAPAEVTIDYWPYNSTIVLWR